MLKKQGLYLPEFEHENCGAGFICNLKGEKTNQIIHDALEILVKLEHRGGVSSDGKTGDGAGLLIDIPHAYFKRVCGFKIPVRGKYAIRHTTQDVRCIVKEVRYKMDINSLHRNKEDNTLNVNDIGRVVLRTTTPLFVDSYRKNRITGSVILIDESTNSTVGAGMII